MAESLPLEHPRVERKGRDLEEAGRHTGAKVQRHTGTRAGSRAATVREWIFQKHATYPKAAS